tara:strand:+ start:2697 stop:3479 length:783 start_codon:yes stop_codon:yes gene_type:complete
VLLLFLFFFFFFLFFLFFLLSITLFFPKWKKRTGQEGGRTSAEHLCRFFREMYQHLEVEYEEYASTSSSKHHGYKTEVSEGNKRVRELDDIESALAKIYAEIDCGDQVADIIGGKDVQKRIEDLDRRGKTNGGEKYLTYPENARYFLDEDGEEEDGDRLKLEEALETFGLEDGKKETAKENALAISSTLAERAMDMPLVAVRRGKQNNNAMYMVKSTKRPPKRIEYDFTIGRLPDRRIEDEELDKDNEGKFAYRDLESID